MVKEYRTTEEIACKILQVSKDGESITGIMNRANLNSGQVKHYLYALQQTGYMKAEKNPNYKEPKKHIGKIELDSKRHKKGDTGIKPSIRYIYTTTVPEGLDALKKLEESLPVLETLKKFL